MNIEYIKLKEKDIQKGLVRHFDTNVYHLLNAYIFDNNCESDYFAITKAGYSHEIEVKLSKNDFIAENKKVEKYYYLENFSGGQYVTAFDKKYLMVTEEWKQEIYNRKGYCDVNYKEMKNVLPNKFSYACPYDVINKNDVPDYAGLYYVEGFYNKNIGKNVYKVKEIKKPKFIHKNKFNNWNKLLWKFYLKYFENVLMVSF